MIRVHVPPIERGESHDSHPSENTAWSAAPMTWACRTPEAARVVASVFAGDFGASPRAARRFVPWSRARAIRDAVDAQPALPGMAAIASGIVRRGSSYAERTARQRASVAARVGRYQ